jgi:hypothetical protein
MRGKLWGPFGVVIEVDTRVQKLQRVNSGGTQNKLRAVFAWLILLPLLFLSACAPKSKVVWHQAPAALIPMKREDDLLGRFVGADEMEPVLEVRWIVATKKGRGLLFFSQNGRLLGTWAGDPEAHRLVDAYEAAMLRVRRFQNALKEKKPEEFHNNLAFATTRFWIEELDFEFREGVYRNGPPRPLDPSKSPRTWKANAHFEIPLLEESRRQMTPAQMEAHHREEAWQDERFEADRKWSTGWENLALEDAIFQAFKELVSGTGMRLGKPWTHPLGGPTLAKTFEGKHGQRRSLEVYSQNFITPSGVGIAKYDVWTGTFHVTWGGKPLCDEIVQRSESSLGFCTVFDGRGLLVEERNGKDIQMCLFLDPGQ